MKVSRPRLGSDIKRPITLDGVPVEAITQVASETSVSREHCASYKAGVMVKIQGRQSPAFAAVLSHDGMELVTRRQLEPDTAVTVRFPVPGAGRLQVDAVTRWQRVLCDGAHTYLTALRFPSLTPAQARCLDAWIARQEKTDPPAE